MGRMPPDPPATAVPEPAAPATRGLILVGPGAAFGGELLVRFGLEGFRLGVVARSADTLGRLTGELASAGLTMRGAVADVTDAAGFTAALEGLADDLGGLTVLVYNAKLSIRGNAFSVPADVLNQTLAVNVTGALTAVQAATPLLVDRVGATILVTAAGTRTEPPGGRFALAVGKAGLAALAAAVGPTLADHGVRLRTVVLDGRVGPSGPLRPQAVADHFWQAYAAPRGTVFRLAAPGPRRAAATLPLEV
ncbi:SDR family NAD(P)-dependent oxidoreductase [Frankia sp. CNm7]|uniref:SDR family NAD(P)-dependent oxidoreductase n=1 Tax=Frankia nepalensis TaxID=1836974 RepID=A0A937UKT3_9ACTN|nr:SDR family NAD(P)-dependent oxidoreductase [Frankia nepalensis]MBL7497671.1 SDR family NAD(P)-dependent oxidoreductase [Frankia nepalensis]MBL7513422.1 SDR family NAD(P)-dependent oxidoreductase [Frankia nepalensis]MBL7523304.1 SDR family NAD(P)-dependent oxidoreductase [Frankia nepalensis]MBL7627134.1 SDR family NAD(P)-dependent oxidoreductase [Frankia nepalensis]